VKIPAFSAPPELFTLLRCEAETRHVPISQVIRESIAERYGSTPGPSRNDPQHVPVPAHIPEGVVIG
jgi:hypothetical protein